LEIKVISNRLARSRTRKRRSLLTKTVWCSRKRVQWRGRMSRKRSWKRLERFIRACKTAAWIRTRRRAACSRSSRSDRDEHRLLMILRTTRKIVHVNFKENEIFLSSLFCPLFWSSTQKVFFPSFPDYFCINHHTHARAKSYR